MLLHVIDQFGIPVYHARIFAAKTCFPSPDMPHFKATLLNSQVNNKAQVTIPDTDLNVFIRVRAEPFLQHECVTDGRAQSVVVVLYVDPSYEGVEGYGWAFYGKKIS